MKNLPPADGNFQWNRKLVSQVQFIKTHLRYPLRPIIALKLTSFAGLLPLLLWFGMRPFLFKSESPSSKPAWPLIVMGVVALLLIGIGIYRFSQTLKFVTVKTAFGITDNIQLLKSFLSEAHFAHSQHPEAPEIFQMLSRNIGGQKEAREVVIFIADTHRILVNSHFTGSRKGSPIGLPHYKEMAKMLAQWLAEREALTNEVRRF